MQYTKDNTEFMDMLDKIGSKTHNYIVTQTRRIVEHHKELTRGTINELFVYFHNEYSRNKAPDNRTRNIYKALEQLIKHKLAEELDAYYGALCINWDTIVDIKYRRYKSSRFSRASRALPDPNRLGYNFNYLDHMFCLVYKNNKRKVKFIVGEPYYNFVEDDAEKTLKYNKYIEEINKMHNKIGLFFRAHDFPTTWCPGATKMFLIGRLEN